MRFEFSTATRILFGPGALADAASLVGSAGTRTLVVTGNSTHRASRLLGYLEAAGIVFRQFAFSGEPTIETVRNGLQAARLADCQVVLALGGGSAIDAGKAIAILLTNGGDPLDYLEIIGAGRPLSAAGVPFVAIPTTAGTGSEVTRNAVLGSPEHGVKVSLRSVHMLPRAAIVDPELTYTLSPAVTAASGMDALTQLIEPFVSNRANPVTDLVCRDGIERAGRSLRRAYAVGDDAPAREDMALASLYGGMALANARLGAVHGIAGPTGGLFPAPHGAVCARLLPEVMSININALRARDPEAEALSRYTEVSRILTANDRATPEHGVEWVRSLVADLRIPPLASHGIHESDFAALATKARRASSMQGNPIALTDEELQTVLRGAL